MGLPLSPQVCAILSGLIESHAGLHYGLDSCELLGDKVSGPAMEAGFDSLLDYYYFLRYDPEGPKALRQLVDSLLVHETYFFREAPQLVAMIDHALVPRIEAGRRPRVWCAACATGEEPLTLAILLAQRDLLGRVELHATDLSQRALERASRGEYGRRSLRALPPGIEGRFLEIDGDRARVSPKLREAIHWGQLNLVDTEAIARMGTFDAILCRNVLIYFSDETARRVIDALSAALRDGGHLLVGTSESLLRFGTGLVCEERGGAFLYSKVVS
jgi:chemotaxis protein methyltransferase CheR